MKLQTKSVLGILLVFAVLVAGITATCVYWVNRNTIQAAEHRVNLYIRSSWEIYNAKLERLLKESEVLAQNDRLRALLLHPDDESVSEEARQALAALRSTQDLDVLTVLDPQGRVVLRTRPPYNAGDVLAGDSLIAEVLAGQPSRSGTLLFDEARLTLEGGGLLDRCLESGGQPEGMMLAAAVPVWDSQQLIGILQVGNLLNGANAEVDRIRDAVFEDEYYKGKPLGTATIFMRDVRVSTNVLDENGSRALGTRVSPEVAKQVLGKGRPWTGRAWVVDAWYLSQYDPLRDPDGEVIGILYVGELEQKYLDARTQALTLFLGVILGGLVLALLVFLLITRGILRPVRDLSAATRRLAGGDLAHRVPVATHDELGELAASFNTMAGQLEAQRAEITSHQAKLEVLNEELRSTNRNYMELLGFVAHELMNPLSSAMLSLEAVKDGYLGALNANQHRSLGSVAVSLDYFRDMIRNYLDLSRLEKGELRPVKTRVKLLDDVVEPIMEGLARGLLAKGMVLENNIPQDMVVLADRDLLRIVYDNLLSNAVKYGREGGRIVLGASDGARHVTLSVANEGAGIPPQKMPLLFRKFSRLDDPEYAGKKGTGLGLYITKEIVEKQGGRIWAESETDRWARFVFTLPEPDREES